MNNNKKTKILSLLAIITILITVIGATFAYFRTQGISGTSKDISVTSNTTDLLSFQINKDIDLVINQNNLGQGLGNASDSSTLTARLTPNNNTGEASDSYNVFFIIDRNEFVYTTENGTAELLLSITDPNNNPVEQISGLRKIGNSFDITTKTGAILIAADYPIAASNSIEEIQSWTVTVTMVNLETDQFAQTGRMVTGKLFLTKENLNEYELASISGLNTDISGVSSVTATTITLNLNVGNGTENIDTYYYGIEDPSLAYLPVSGSIVKLSSSPVKDTLALNEPSHWYNSENTTYTFTNLTPNTLYKVYAYATDSRGFISNIYSTLVKTSNIVLPKVTGVLLDTTQSSISVDVTALDGDSAISNYYYSIDNGETWVEDTSSHTFTNLLDSAEYNIKVKVKDADGNESSAYYERAKTTIYQEPIINNIVVTQTSNSISLAIEATRGTNNVSKYQYSIDNGTTWEDGTVNKTYTGLTADTDYTIKVKAIDAKNIESALYVVNVRTGEYELPQITGVKVRQLPTSLTITVTGENGTNNITKYYYSIQDGRNYIESESNTYIFNDLSSNATYYIKVYAEDSEGRISTVYSTSAKTVYVSPVINEITKTITASSITLNIDAEGKSNEIANYQYRLSDNDEWSTSATSTINLTGLTSDTDYNIQVKVIDTDNHDSNITVVNARTSYINPVITNLEVTNQTWDSITVRATATAGSHQISKYYFKTDQSSYVESNSNEYTFTGLNDGGNVAINYEITAYVVDTEYNNLVSETKGKSELVKVNTATTAYTLPTISVTSSKTSSSITLNATATQGTGAISKYSYSVDDGAHWIEQSSSNTTNSYTFTGLNDNTSYDIKVKVTDVNNREATYTGTISTDYIEPVINGVTNTKTWNSITLTINATAGSTAIDKYYFRTSTGSYDSGQASNVKTFSGLTEDTEYTFYVKLIDVGGHEVTEQSVTVRTNDYNEPTLALNGAIQTTYNTVTVNVTGAANETGATIVSYSFQIDSETPVVVNSSSTSASHTFNVAEDQTHSIEVNMTDSFGRVATVTSTGIATPAYVYPLITSVTASDETINSIKVTVVASDGQNAIRGYKFSTDGGSTYGSVVTTTSHNYEYTLTGLNDNTNYSIKVIAVDDIDRESSAGSTSTSTLYKEPTVILSYTGLTYEALTLTATATPGSTAISTYNFKKGSEGWTGTQAGSTYSGFNDLDPGTQYSFTVEITDAAGHTATDTLVVSTLAAPTPTVTFVPNNGTSVASTTVTYKSPYGNLTASTRNGYQFNGWYIDSTLDTLVQSSTIVSNPNNHNLYAGWTANTYTIAFDKNHNDASGTTSSISNAAYDSSVNLTANGYTRTGYTFIGWSTSANGTKEYDDEETNVSVATLASSAGVSNTNNATITLYAVWQINSYKQTTEIRYENADGTWTSYTTAEELNVNYNSNYSWSTSQITNFDSTTYQAASVTSYTVTGTHTNQVSIYRNMVTCNQEYRLENADGSWDNYISDGYVQVKYGSSCSYTKSVTNYRGSSTGANGTSATTSANNVTGTQTLQVSLYRDLYTCSKQYRLENANGSWGDYIADGSVANVKYGATCSYSRAVTDYRGSSTGANDSQGTTSQTVSGATTLSLNFYRNKYTLTTDKNSTFISSVSPASGSSYKWGEGVSISATPNSYSNFSSWSQTAGTTSSFNSSTSASTTFIMPKSNATIKANGTGKNYTITFNFDSGISNLVIKSGSTTTATISTNGGTASLTYASSYTINPTYKSGYVLNTITKTTGSGTVSGSTFTVGGGTGTVSVTSKVQIADKADVYYHTSSLENSTQDGSYRYSGANPNNYVCFGSTASTCPAGNLYRIIGFMPVKVVTSGTNTQNQMLYKLIKNDYVSSTEIGLTSTHTADKYSSYSGPSGNQPSGTITAYYWTNPDSLTSGDYPVSTNQYNTWGNSTLNTRGLNTNFINYLGNTWSSKIATVMWKVGSNTDRYVQYGYIADAYTGEITNAGIKPSEITGGCDRTKWNNSWCDSQDGKTELANKIGLMYVSDYTFAAATSQWRNYPQGYSSSAPYDWLYRGVDEYTISRGAHSFDFAFGVSNMGHIIGMQAYSIAAGIRPVFYLNQSTTINMTDYAGTAANPYRIN